MKKHHGLAYNDKYIELNKTKGNESTWLCLWNKCFLVDRSFLGEKPGLLLAHLKFICDTSKANETEFTLQFHCPGT